MAEPLRLAKRVAAQAGCSRREAEWLIEGGWVRVDGQVVEDVPARVQDAQHVEIAADARPEPIAPATFLWHKPAGLREGRPDSLLTPGNRSPLDATPGRLLKKHFSQLTALLPLPEAASGLAVCSQDPRVIRKLVEDAHLIEQEMIAEVAGSIAEGGLARLCHGLSSRGRALPPIKVSWQSEARLRLALKGIAPDEVPGMCAQVGLQVTALRRIRIGRVPLAQLAAGQWRYLAGGERF